MSSKKNRKKEKTIKVINIVSYSLAIILLSYIFINYFFIENVPNCASDYSGKNTLNHLNLGNNSILLKINGTSMMNTIKENSECICSKKESYKINDIIVFSYITGWEKITIMHRIINATISENNTYFTTRGDKNNFTDSLVIPEKAVFCSVEEKHRFNI